MNLTEILTKVALTFSESYIITPIIILGFYCYDKNKFSDIILLTLTSILFNYALKVTFKVPLNPGLAEVGFAFPSGHMQTSFVFYMMLYDKIKIHLIRILIIPILALIGYSLVQAGYHNYFDVGGGVFVGIAVIWLYSKFEHFKYNHKYLIFLFINIALLCYSYFNYGLNSSVISMFLSFCGFSTSIFLSKLDNFNNAKTKILATLLCLILFSIPILLQLLFKLNGSFDLKWLCLGIIIPGSYFIVSKKLILKKYQT